MRIGLIGYLWRYVFYFAVVVAAIYGVLTLFERFAPDVAAWFYGSGASTGLNVAAVMLPGIYLGQKWARTEGRAMPRGFGWGLASLCAVLATAMCVALARVLLELDPGLQAAWAEIQTDMEAFWVVMAGLFVFLVLITRLAIWTAVRGELKRLARPTS